MSYKLIVVPYWEVWAKARRVAAFSGLIDEESRRRSSVRSYLFITTAHEPRAHTHLHSPFSRTRRSSVLEAAQVAAGTQLESVSRERFSRIASRNLESESESECLPHTRTRLVEVEAREHRTHTERIVGAEGHTIHLKNV